MLFGRKRKPTNSGATVQPIEPVICVDAAGAAVAGYVVRLPRRTNFHLPARIASVAYLNTPQGRKPAGKALAGAAEARRPVYAPMQKRSIPLKPLHAPATGRAAQRPSATIIQLPASAAERGQKRRLAA